MTTKFSSIILAAGKGTRMYSDIPKVLHKVGQKAMLQHVIDAVNTAGAQKNYVICGYQADLIKESILDPKKNINWVYQAEQRGTGHAVAQAQNLLTDDELALVLFADAPLLKSETVQEIVSQHADNSLSIFSIHLDNPFGYGRIMRDEKGDIMGIIEEKDGTPEQRKIKEVYPGGLLASGKIYKELLPLLSDNNAQKEIYLTEMLSLAYERNIPIYSYAVNPEEMSSANDRLQLENLERIFQKRNAEEHLLKGLSVKDKSRVDILGELVHGKDCTLDINVIINGKVVLGNNVYVGAGSILTNMIIGDNTYIKPYSVLSDSVIGESCEIGPFSHIRPNTNLQKKVKVGNFVELKKALVADGAKINHLSYIGDAIIGKKTNIGAGVITCNYDGVNKHQTVIGDDVFVGSDVQLIAPVCIANNITIGAGSTVTKNVVEDSALVVSRAKLIVKQNWPKPVKKTS